MFEVIHKMEILNKNLETIHHEGKQIEQVSSLWNLFQTFVASNSQHPFPND